MESEQSTQPTATTTDNGATTSATPTAQKPPRSVHSMFHSFKENVVLNAECYSYYTAIVLLSITIIILYCDFSTMSTSGFFWMIVNLVIVMFNAWLNTMMFLKL